MKDSFILYGSHEENFKMLSDTDKGKLIMAIFAFVRDEDISATLKPLAKMAYVSITNQIKISNEKYDRRCETSRLNGQLGGAPKGNQNAKKKQEEAEEQPNQPKNNLNQPNQPIGCLENEDENNLKQPKNNLINLNNPNDNDYDNEYDNDNIKLVNKENIFNNYNACTHACVSEKSEEERKPFINYYSDIFSYYQHETTRKPALEIIDTMIEALYQAKSPEGLKFKQIKYNANNLLDVFRGINVDSFFSIMRQLKYNEDIENRALYILGCIVQASDLDKIDNSIEGVSKFNKFRNDLINIS